MSHSIDVRYKQLHDLPAKRKETQDRPGPEYLTSNEIEVSTRVAPRAALVISVDEFFRLALIDILMTKFNCNAIVQMGIFDPQHEMPMETGPIDLVIAEADWVLNSSDRLSNLRRRYPGTRVVVVSQSARRDDILSALRAGAHGFVPKGGSVANMVEALAAVLSGTLWIPKSLADDAIESEGVGSRPFNKRTTDIQELTPRQLEVLQHIVQGNSNKQIARLMSLSAGTVKIHVAGVLRNLGVANRARAAAIGSRQISSAKPPSKFSDSTKFSE